MRPPFEAVIFDNDGLLLDTEVAWTRAEKTLFGRRGRAFTMDDKRYLIGSSGPEAERKLEEMLERPGEGPALLAELNELVMEEVLEGAPPRPGALELLEAVSAAGIPAGLASNSPRPFVERALRGAGLLNGRFGVVITADEVARGKPAPDLYLAACDTLGAAPERSAALEDSPPGVASAVAAGLFTIAVPYFEDADLAGASLTASSLADPRVAAALGLAT